MKDGEEQSAAGSCPSLSWLILVVGLLSVLICSAFTAIASIVVLAQSVIHDLPDETPFLIKLSVKAVFFAGLASAMGLWLWRLRPRTPWEPPETLEAAPVSNKAFIVLILVILFAAALVLPNLERYPKAEPDETYHLVFARNLAVYGVYGSGHPDTGFEPFDSYASVGAPVLGPVAAAFRLAGVSLVSARVCMALSLIALCVSAFFVLKPVFGAPAGVVGALFVITSFASVYLGRSLYGEVPALAYFTLGLILWRKALARERFSFPGVFAGVAFALAVLSKMFLGVSACAFLGVWIYDRMTYKRVRLIHVAAPAAGFIALYGCWAAVQALGAEQNTEAVGGTVLLHRNLLLFGLKPLPVTSKWLLKQPVTVLTAIVAALATIPIVFRRKYDPATAVLVFLIPLYTFWWLFFASGLHPRYMFYACAAASILTAPLFWSFLRTLFRKDAIRWRRIACAAMICVVLARPVCRTHGLLVYVYSHDEMREDRELAEYVSELSDECTLGTTFYPVIRSLNFHCGRAVKRLGRDPNPVHAYNVVIIDSVSQGDIFKGIKPSRTIGRYAIFATTP